MLNLKKRAILNSEPVNYAIARKAQKIFELKEIIIKFYCVIYSIAGSGLLIKQLCTNLTYFLLSAFLQTENIDLQYQINVKSIVLCLISTLFFIKLLVHFISTSLLGYNKFKHMKTNSQKVFMTNFESAYIRFNLKSWFLRLYQVYCSTKKLLFVAILIFCFKFPLASLVIIIL